MNLGWPEAAVLTPIVTALIVGVWKLAKFEEKYMPRGECEDRHEEHVDNMARARVESGELRGLFGRMDERIKTLFNITERQESTTAKLEEIVRKNGGP